MRTAYLDCFSGISGDMILGALVDAGVALEDIASDLASLDLPGWELRTDPAARDPRIHMQQPHAAYSSVLDAAYSSVLDAAYS